jgi:hypothetical protein
MALPTIIQTAQTHTSSAGPASVAPSWSPSAAGSTLVAVVACALSGAPTVSTPANWTAGPVRTQGTAMDLRLFYYVNNPGSLTTATFNLTNVNGCAVGFFEIANLNTVAPYDFGSGQANSNAGSTAVSCPAYTAVPYGGQLLIGAVCQISTQAFTPANISGQLAWTTGPTDTSNTGATNVILATYSMSQGTNPSPLPAIAGTLAGAVAWCAGMWAFMSTSSGQLLHAGVATLAGAGQGYATGI